MTASSLALNSDAARSRDVWVIGAGMAGLLCAQWLRHWGYSVGVVDKSRGLGGRVATRRLAGTCGDHGARCLEAQGTYTEQLIQIGQQGHPPVVVPWDSPLQIVAADGTSHMAPTPRYVAPLGMTAIAKTLAADLPILRGQRVESLQSIHGGWELSLEPSPETAVAPLTSRGLVLAIPAPQAVPLLAPLRQQGLPQTLLTQVQSVTFDPCITAIATYRSPLSAQGSNPYPAAIQFEADPVLAWISLESSKRPIPQDLPTPDEMSDVVVIQSSAAFAAACLEAPDLTSYGQALLDAADQYIPGLRSPTQLQVHRWRYAFARQPLTIPKTCAQNSWPGSAVPAPLAFSGDWCQGNTLESALEAGERAAQAMNHWLDQRPTLAASLSELLAC